MMFKNKKTHNDTEIIRLNDRFSQGVSRKRTQWIAVIVFAVIGSVMTAVDANADGMRVANLGHYGSLNLRSAPTTSASVIDSMPKGAVNLDWTGKQIVNGSTLWYEINFNGKRGWASAAYLEPYDGTFANEYAPNYGYVPSPPVSMSINASGEYYVAGDEVAAALFGLAVGGIVGAVISSASNNDEIHVTPPSKPTPAPIPRPKPRRFQLNCSGDGVHFIYQRQTSEIDLTINGRQITGTAIDRVSDGKQSFAIPFTTYRSEGTLFVENIRREGSNASLYWGGRHNQGLYRLACYRERIW